ncbi:DUF421 domain-containing protein [uncultured Cardiobacterium sp.]|uniref:DUF421 domain-containing protein n=1 Tax=uncultured Cardiobacterium sp. TaxID=417619 RepID=UPI00260AE1C5|nr:DUF421 domain-containing protein [uncultured Cardiobacterium sp.]
MFYLLVAVKLILGFLALVLVINLTGKGNLAPASASDQVQNYVLGGIVGGVIYNPDITILEFLLILVIWFALALSLRWLKKHNSLVKRIVDGQPVLLISRGKIDVEAVRRVGMSAHELAFKLRTQGAYAVKDVKQVILEQDGRLIITQMGEEKPKYPLITDGVIQQATLDMIDKDEDWLQAELQAQGYTDASAVFLAEYEHGQITITGY